MPVSVSVPLPLLARDRLAALPSWMLPLKVLSESSPPTPRLILPLEAEVVTVPAPISALMKSDASTRYMAPADTSTVVASESEPETTRAPAVKRVMPV